METQVESESNAITVVPVKGNELYSRYRGQGKPQPAQVVFDPRAGRLYAEADPCIDCAPEDEWHRLRLMWGIPTLKAEAANDLLERLMPFCERIANGFEVVWNGHSKVGQYTRDAEAAIETVRSLCEGEQGRDSDAEVHVWDAADWLGGIGSDASQRAELGITAATTDEELDAIGLRVEDEATCEGVDVIEGLDRYLKALRDGAREES